eukprot:11218746-Lingulodinium_polyedra.AAC.1
MNDATIALMDRSLEVLGPGRLQRQWEERVLKGAGTNNCNADFAQARGQHVNVTTDPELNPLGRATSASQRC